MEENDIGSIIGRFDQFVEASLVNKNTQKSLSQPTHNQLEIYFHNMENRLKLKTVTQNQKFQQILAPMKKLKSFVNIKDFLRTLNNKPQRKTNSSQTLSQQTKQRLQYEDLRGGVYMEKVENHLRRNHMKRKIDTQAEMLLKQLEDNHSNNDYGKWMEDTLSKISLKEETFLQINEQKDICFKNRKQTEKLTVFEDFTNKTKKNNLKNSKMQNYRNRRIEKSQEKNFKKVSDFLTERLRRLLTDKYVNNSSKGKKRVRDVMTNYSNAQYISTCRMMTQPAESAITSKRPLSRASCRSKRQADIKSFQSRAQTSEGKKRRLNDDDENWRDNVTNRMQNLVNTTVTYQKKCRQERKQYKTIVNPFSEI